MKNDLAAILEQIKRIDSKVDRLIKGGAAR